jgi:hypothetical protein
MGYFSCLPGSFLRADTHIARFPARIQSLSGPLSSRVLRLAKRATGYPQAIETANESARIKL